MFSSIVIVFREVFEMAIVISVILAATRTVPLRGWYVLAGIVAGAAVVSVMALFAPYLMYYATRLGQHVYHAIVLFTAAILICWSVIWMQEHGAQIAHHIKTISQSIKEGSKPLYMLAIVSGLTVMREGSEIVLFLYGVYSGGEVPLLDIFLGGLVGAGLGIATGTLMYWGLIRVPVKQLFQVSGWLLVFLAAGMIAKGVGHLVAAQMLPALGDPIWDTSNILSQRELIGRFLSILVGYQDHPAGIQVLFYVGTVIIISTVLKKEKTATPSLMSTPLQSSQNVF